MRPAHYWIALLIAVGCAASRSNGVVALSSLNDPTLQTLISMGSTSVAVGPYDFSNFGFIDASTGVAHTAGQIQIQSFSNHGYGLQFVASWYASDGADANDVISFDVAAADPTKPIAQISLLSNGTAPVAVPGTFTSNTLISSVIGGTAAAPVISTYNDGFTMPVDTTRPDVNYAIISMDPQEDLHIIDTLFAISTAANDDNSGGVVTESVLQNGFFPGAIPEPGHTGWIFVPLAIVVMTGRRSGPLSRYSGRGLG
jgi:hypothetical protein